MKHSETLNLSELEILTGQAQFRAHPDWKFSSYKGSLHDEDCMHDALVFIFKSGSMELVQPLLQSTSECLRLAG